MSSTSESVLALKAKDFQSRIEKCREGELSLVQVLQSFKDFLLCAKSKAKDDEEINLILDCIHIFLKYIIDYAGIGSASLKLTTLRMLFNKISRGVEFLQMEYDFLKGLSIPIFEILLDPELQTWISKEVLKMYCVTIQSTDRAVRISIVEGKFSYYMARLMDLIPFGDYEFQVLIVEILFRMYTKQELEKQKDIFFFKTEEQKNAFYNIDTRKFDLSVRLFLNLINEAEKNVISILCHKVCLDEFQLHKPHELSSFKGLWVDFNVKVRTISFYINSQDYCDETETDDAMWEIVTIFAGSISNLEISFIYNEEERRKEAIGKLILKNSCMLLKTLSEKLSNSRTLTLHSLNVEKLKEIFHQDIPKMTRKIKIKQIYTPLKRRGYKPLDIISVKSSTTNPSSTFNYTFNAEIDSNKWKRARSTDGKNVSRTSSRSLTISPGKSVEANFELNIGSNANEMLENANFIEYALDKYKDSVKSSSSDHSMLKMAEPEVSKRDKTSRRQTTSKTYVYEDAFMSRLMEIEPDSHGKRNSHSNSYPEAFHRGTDPQIPRIKINKNQKTVGYAEKFSSRLLEIKEDSHFKVNQGTSYGKAFDAKLMKLDVPPLLRNKKDHSRSCDQNWQLTKTEPDSTTLESKGCIRNSDLLIDENVALERSAVLSYSTTDIPFKNPSKRSDKHRVKKTKSGKKRSDTRNSRGEMRITLTDSYASDYKDEKNSIRGGEIDRFKSENMRRNKVSITNCSPELFSSQIEISNNDEKQPPLSENVNKTDSHKLSSKISIFINSLRNLEESPDSIRDCQRDLFEELKLERPKQPVQFQHEANIDTTIDDPNQIKITNKQIVDIVSDNTEFFETARMDLDAIEIPESQLYVGNSLGIFNDITQEEVLSMGVQNPGQDSDSNSLLEQRPRIKILTNIKIHSSFDKVERNNIHTWNKSEIKSWEQENELQHSRDETAEKKIETINSSKTFDNLLDIISQNDEKLKESENQRTKEDILKSVSEREIEEATVTKSLLKKKTKNKKQRVCATVSQNTLENSILGIERSVSGFVPSFEDKRKHEQKFGNSNEKIIETLNTIRTESINAALDRTSFSPNNSKSNVGNIDLSYSKDILTSVSEFKAEETARTLSSSNRVSDQRKRKLYDTFSQNHPEYLSIENKFTKSVSRDVSVSRFENKPAQRQTKSSNRKRFNREKNQSEDQAISAVQDLAYPSSSLSLRTLNEDTNGENILFSPTAAGNSKKGYETETYFKKENEAVKNKVPYVKLEKLSKGQLYKRIIETFSSDDDLPLSVLKKQLIGNMKIKNSEITLTNSNLAQHEGRDKKMIVQNKICDKNVDDEDELFFETVLQSKITSPLKYFQSHEQENAESCSITLSHNVPSLSALENNSHHSNSEIPEQFSKQIEQIEGNSTHIPIEKKMYGNNSQSQYIGQSINPFQSESISPSNIVENRSLENIGVALDRAKPSQEEVSVCEVTLSQKSGPRLNKRQHNSENTKNVSNVSGQSQNDEGLAPSVEVEKNTIVANSRITIHNVTKIDLDVQDHSRTDVRFNTDNRADKSQLINIFNSDNTASLLTASDLGPSTHKHNNRDSQKFREKKNRNTPPLLLVSSKQDEVDQKFTTLPDQNLLARVPVSELNSISLPHHMPSINDYGCERDIGIQICTDHTENEPQNGNATIDECIQKKTNGSCGEQYDLSDEIEKSMYLLFGTEQIEHSYENNNTIPTKNDFQHLKDTEQKVTNGISNSVITPLNGKMLRGVKLYNPDNPEETLRNLPEFMEISRENEMQHMSKIETDKKLEKDVLVSTKTEKNSKYLKNRKSIEQENRKGVTTISIKNEQLKKLRKKSPHTKNFRRLDILFDEVLEKLNSRNYSTRTTSSKIVLKKHNNKIENKKYDLDFSMVTANIKTMEKNHISKVEHSLRGSGSLPDNINNFGRNNSGKENINIDSQENDRALKDFLGHLGIVCAKLASGRLKMPNSHMKKNLFAVSQLLQDF